MQWPDPMDWWPLNEGLEPGTQGPVVAEFAFPENKCLPAKMLQVGKGFIIARNVARQHWTPIVGTAPRHIG